MKHSRLIAGLFALILFVSGTPFAHAQNDPSASGLEGQINSGSTIVTPPSSNPNDPSASGLEGQINSGSSITNPPSSTAPAGGAADSAAKSPTNPAAGAPTDILDWIMAEILRLFAWLLGIAAITLDNAVYYTVVHMGSYVNSLSAVGVAWRILRDIGNIILIFGFLALGITVILDVDWYGGRMKMLPILLIAAIFLNFSLFVAEAVIDTGNLFATQFYTQINGGVPAAPKDLVSLSNISNEGISHAVMNQLGLQTIYGNATQPDNAIFKSGNIFLLSFMAILLFMIAAFVFFSLAFVLIARFIFLIFLIIVAPIGFAGLAVPKLDKLAHDWWEALFAQTITAPVMLLMLYVALAVITDASFLTGLSASDQQAAAASNLAQSAWTSWITGSTPQLANLASAILSFLVAMGLLLAVTMLAKKMGAVGGSWATNMGGKITGGIVGYGFLGGASLAGRGTFGLGGRLLNNKRIQAGAAQGGVRGLGYKALAFTGRNLENRTFDARNVKTFQKIGGAVGNALGSEGSGFDNVALGHGATITAKTAVDSAIEAKKKYIPFSGDWWRDQQKEYEKAAKELNKKDVFATGVTADIKTEFKKMSTDEIAELKGIRDGLDNFVAALTPTQYAELQKSDKLLKGEKKHLDDAWQKQFDVSNVKTTLARLTPEDIPTLGGKILSQDQVTDQLEVGQFNDIQRNSKISAEDKKKIRNSWEKQFTPAKLAGLTVDETASLSGDVLSRYEIAEHLGTSELEAIRRKGSLTLAQRQAISAHLSTPGAVKQVEYKEYLDTNNDKDGTRNKYWNV